MLGCKENRRYKMGVQKNRFPRSETEEKDFLIHPSSIDDFHPSSINSIFASIKRYLEEKNYKENIVTSDLFKGTRDALASKKKELKAMGMGNTPNKVNNFLGKKKVKYTKCHIPFYLRDVMLKFGDKNATSPQKSLPS